MDTNLTIRDVAQIGPLSGLAARRPDAANSADSGQFARALDKAAASRTDQSDLIPSTIPADVWAEVERAGQLAEDLAADGKFVRFDTHQLSGRVVASLVDEGGSQIKSMTLSELLDGGMASNPRMGN